VLTFLPTTSHSQSAAPHSKPPHPVEDRSRSSGPRDTTGTRDAQPKGEASRSKTANTAKTDAAQTKGEAAQPSDTTVFLFGSGFAIFIALLGWSEQIRGLRRETYQLQSEFLKTHGLRKADLLRAIRAQTADEQLRAFTAIMLTNKLSASAVQLLPILRRWDTQNTRLERLQTWKYWLTVALAFVFFAAGGSSLARLGQAVSVGMPAVVLLVVFGLIIATNTAERKLHSTLNELLDGA
jgi:hypothetical protein